MFHDTVMSLVVVVVIVGSPSSGTTRTSSEPADSATRPTRGRATFVPRPDWYFYFLFYLLRIFKWPETVILATVGIPTICLILLLVLPFIDLRTERRLSRRPVAVVGAALTVLSMGVAHVQGRDRGGGDRERGQGRDPELGDEAGLHGQPAGDRTARTSSPSPAARTATPTSAPAASNLGAPDLSAEGAKNKGSSSRSTTSSARAASTRARRCRRSPRSGTTTCASSRPS